MKPLLLSLLLVLTLTVTKAQQFTWAVADTSGYQMNPDIASGAITSFGSNVVTAALVDHELIYGSELYGEQSVRCHNASGTSVYQISFGPMAAIDHLAAAPNGNVYVAGSFMDTLWINNSDTMLLDAPGLFARNPFICCFDANGNLLWKRNIRLQNPDCELIEAITVDNNGNCWYSYFNWQTSYVKGMDTNGQDVDSVALNGSFRTISGLSFDAAGNLYVSGAVESGSISIGSYSRPIPDVYNMFLLRLNPAKQVSWFYDIHDITFQHPQIKADALGNVFFSGVLMDSASLGGHTLAAPQWGMGLILAKLDSSGTVFWLKGVPTQGTITGSFQPGNGSHLVADNTGGCILTGRTNGQIDWGNGVVSGQLPAGSNYAITVLGINAGGQATWKLDGTAFYVNPVAITLTSATEGYVTAITRGTVDYGSIQLPQPSPFTFATTVAKFSTTTTGLSAPATTASFGFYPNPGKGTITFNRAMEAGQFTITDLAGKVVKIVEVEKGTMQLEIGLPAGLYHLTHSVQGTRTLIISN